jgi:hypothetical protein
VIKTLPASAADDTVLMSAVTELINLVYKESERGLWHDDATRTTHDEVVALTRAGELVIAGNDDQLTGVVRVQRLDSDTGEFGMLAAERPTPLRPIWGASSTCG